MDGNDNSWVFDSLICFLNGPVWNAPLQSFIEEKSLIFEPTHKENDEYRKIHDEFKNLVDLMLGSYMEDIGITPEQFETACNNGMHQKLPTQFQENLFEQIWAANDFEMFKRMMTQKNIELQLQALELIEQKYGTTPKLFLPSKEHATLEKPALQDVSSSSALQTPCAASISIPSEKQVLVEVIKQCESDSPTPDIDAEELSKDKSYLLEEKQMLENVLQSTVADTNKPETYTKPVGTQVDDVEMKKRQEYLKAQRDKLVALKKQVRKKHLEIEMANPKRPQSARAAENLLARGHVDVQPETLKIRQALVERLRSEVINKNDAAE